MDEVKQTAEFYERFWEKEDYQLAYAFDSAVRDRFPAILQVWGQLRSPHRVLDYGSGNGVLTSWMYANGFGNELVGIDISQAGVKYAARTFGKSEVVFKTFQPGEALDHLGCFDVVVSSHVLEHVAHPESSLAQMIPLSEWFVLEVPLEECVVQKCLSACGRNRLSNPVGHVNFWTKKKFRSFLQSCGLFVVRDFHYASAPFSQFNNLFKRILERAALHMLGISLYGQFMATHYAVLAHRHPAWRTYLEQRKGVAI
ncbi:MAG TPA: class I SAM-dependent methyltransferase [Nitrospiraceae bacterium]|nr:class I SAM-dependent methyltransferase [Nitrospiraceae bacterium]